MEVTINPTNIAEIRGNIYFNNGGISLPATFHYGAADTVMGKFRLDPFSIIIDLPAAEKYNRLQVKYEEVLQRLIDYRQEDSTLTADLAFYRKRVIELERENEKLKSRTRLTQLLRGRIHE